MSRRTSLLDRLVLQGLELAPAQSWGGVRLVPIVRRSAPGDLRLALRRYGEDVGVVSVDGRPMDSGVKYLSYIPHALVVSWSDDGSLAAFGTHVFKPDGKRLSAGPFSARLLHRMVKREDSHRLRLLPMHLAMEGFLELYFEGPDVAWSEYSRHALRHGLSPRREVSARGWELPGLADALRVFEIHDHQVGVVIFVAEALASAFVVSHPDDYRALHRSMLEDFYGEILVRYGRLPPTDHLSTLSIDDSAVSSLGDLRRAHDAMRDDWASFHRFLASGIIDRSVAARVVYQAGPFGVQRFITDLGKSEENHIGEAIVREDGVLEYLTTFRLSAGQTRRAYLLMQLSKHHWSLDATAASMGVTLDALILRLENAGFAYILHPEVLRASRWRRERGFA